MSLALAAAQIGSSPGDVRCNLDRHLHFLRCGCGTRNEPDRFYRVVTGYVADPIDRLFELLRRMAADSGMTIVAGAPIQGRKRVVHIGSITFRPDGSVMTYFKEYAHSSEELVFTAGRGGELIDLDGTRVALAICRDATFAEHAARAAQAAATVYAASVMIDEAGYGRKSELLRRWAVEHGMAVLMAKYAGKTGGETSAGKSTVWTETGDVIANASDNEECLIIATEENQHWTGRVVPVSKE